MAGCSTHHRGAGDDDAARGRVLGWVAGGAAVVGAAGFLEVASLGTLAGGALALGFAAIVVAAGAGAVLGFFIGYAVNWFDRLHVQDPRTISMAGCVICAGKNTGWSLTHDNDWTFNLFGPSLRLVAPQIAGLDETEILTRDAPGGGPAEVTMSDLAPFPVVFHCEIGSHVGDYAAVGGAVGSTAGAVAGAIIGPLICLALGIATLGIGALLCLLVIAAAILVGAALGGLAGNALGGLAGWIADQLSDFDERGEAISAGTTMVLTGRWITDSSHQHNEIHDIESAQVVDFDLCDQDPTGAGSTGLIAAVGIGRHPTGRDP